MPAFDIGRYVFAVIMIGVIAGALMWVYDQVAPAFNTLIDTGMISHIGVQTATVIYYSIVAYAPINLLFATVGALLVANARSEVNSPLIMTDFSGHILLAVTIFVAFMVNFFTSAFLDTFILAFGGLNITPWGTESIMNTIFSTCHLLCAISVGVGYLYMILNSVRVQSLQWSV